MIRDYDSRVNKNGVREAAFTYPYVISRRRSILTLPSRQIACVRTMLDHRVINKTTKQQWIERDSRIVQMLEFHKKASQMPRITIHAGELEEFVPPAGLDLVNADMEGSFTEAFGLWLENQLADALTDNAYLLITLSVSGRNNMFLHRWLPTQIEAGLLRAELDRVSRSLYQYDPRFLHMITLTYCALHRLTLYTEKCWHYRDRTDMLTMRFRVSHQAPQDHWTPFSTLVANYRQQPIVIQHGMQLLEASIEQQAEERAAAMGMRIERICDDQWRIVNIDTGKSLPPMNLPAIIGFFS